jgi:hypothetical protein
MVRCGTVYYSEIYSSSGHDFNNLLLTHAHALSLSLSLARSLSPLLTHSLAGMLQAMYTLPKTASAEQSNRFCHHKMQRKLGHGCEAATIVQVCTTIPYQQASKQKQYVLCNVRLGVGLNYITITITASAMRDAIPREQSWSKVTCTHARARGVREY